MKLIVGEVTAAIERDIKPGLASTAEHKGFCTALAAVNDRLGIDSVVVGPEASEAVISPASRALAVDILAALDMSPGEIEDILEAAEERARGVIGRFDQEIETPGGEAD
jgi:hypothetical protein